MVTVAECTSDWAQSGRYKSAFQDHSERIITLHTANGKPVLAYR